MLIGVPLVEGSGVSSTDGEPWRAENSFLGMRGKLRRSAGSGMLRDDPLMRGAMLALPITSSGERRTHSSE